MAAISKNEKQVLLKLATQNLVSSASNVRQALMQHELIRSAASRRLVTQTQRTLRVAENELRKIQNMETFD